MKFLLNHLNLKVYALDYPGKKQEKLLFSSKKIKRFKNLLEKPESF